MILCPLCNSEMLVPKHGCTGCGFKLTREDGFLTWAPDLAKSNYGFPEGGFDELIRREDNNFWFRTRNSIIIWALQRYFSDFQSLLEVGCGNGYVLSGISNEFPDARIVGSEVYIAGLKHAARRLPYAELHQMDARKLPYDKEFDLIAAFDVIEHIIEDQLVLNNFYHAIKPGGGCLITVPQHQWLWSPVDEFACHQRRYSAGELHAKAEAAGFSVLRSTSFVTLLLPFMIASRFTARFSLKANGGEELELNPILDRALGWIMSIEALLIKAGVSFPIGGSRLLILQRKKEEV